jgi:hypothetical protein
MTTNVALLVQIEEQHGTYRAVARVVRPQDNGELHNVSWSDRYGDTGKDAARFEGLEVSAYAGAGSWSTFASDTDQKLWGFGVHYAPFRVESAEHAQAIAKTFGQIERGQAKLEAEDGYIREGEFARYVMRVAKALRIRKVYVRNTPRARSLSGENYRLADATFLDFWCQEVTDKITSHELSSLVR